MTVLEIGKGALFGLEFCPETLAFFQSFQVVGLVAGRLLDKFFDLDIHVVYPLKLTFALYLLKLLNF